jgi:predicted MFS family arabinose efflux permease
VGFTDSALVPLAFARTPPVEEAHHVNSWPQSARAAWPHRIFRQGLLIALCGGMLESALAGLFAVFAGDRGFDAEGIAHLLTAFGLGGLLLQYPVGWMADHWGLRAAGALAALGTAVAAALLALAPQVTGLPGVPVAFVAMFVLGGLITAFLTRHGLERQQPLHGLFTQRRHWPGGSRWRHDRDQQRGADVVCGGGGWDDGCFAIEKIAVRAYSMRPRAEYAAQ